MNRARTAIALLVLLLFALCLYRLLTTPTSVSAFSSGPPAGKTGAPGEATCHDCHTTYPLDDPSGSVLISGLPSSYIAGGDPIAFTVTVSQDGTGGTRQDWGFELTVLDVNNVFAGTLVATDATNTKIIDDGGAVDGSVRSYIQHTLAGSTSNPPGFSATWSMSWIPPNMDAGPVTFYVAANAGNGDHTPFGDYIFTNTQTVLGPGTMAAAFVPSQRDRPARGNSAAPRLAPVQAHATLAY